MEKEDPKLLGTHIFAAKREAMQLQFGTYNIPRELDTQQTHG